MNRSRSGLEPGRPILAYVELAELVRWRPVPGAGVLVALTERCPLRCAHCSTAATMAGLQPSAAELAAFVTGFAAAPPRVLLLTGGEPMLRPDLVAELATRARAAGTRTALLTGAFFAVGEHGGGRLPAPTARAVAAVDHLSVSIDAFHERRVPRSNVFRLLRRVLDAGTPVSLHALGDDRYLADLVADSRRVLGGAVPMLVNSLRAVGRAAAWTVARPPDPGPTDVRPCAMAAWPVVAADGAVLACCNQEVVSGRPAPAHLLLGRLGTDDWAAIRARCLASPALRMIRAAGPIHLRGANDGGYCGTCRRLGDHPGILAAINDRVAGLLDEHAARIQAAAGPVALLRRYGSPVHAELVQGEPCPSPTC